MALAWLGLLPLASFDTGVFLRMSFLGCLKTSRKRTTNLRGRGGQPSASSAFVGLEKEPKNRAFWEASRIMRLAYFVPTEQKVKRHFLHQGISHDVKPGETSSNIAVRADQTPCLQKNQRQSLDNPLLSW